MAKTKKQLHLNIVESTDHKIRETLERANALSKKTVSKNELVTAIINNYLEDLTDEELKSLLVRYMLA